MKFSKTLIVATLFTLFSFAPLTAQNKGNIITRYTNELKLDESQKNAFLDIINDLNPKIEESKSDQQMLNRKMKERDLQLFKILSAEQFARYKSVRKDIEPTIFNNNY